VASPPHYWPVAPRVVLAFVVLVFAIAFVQVVLASYAYHRLGLSPAWAYLILVACIAGSRFNVPIVRLRGGTHPKALLVRVYGMWYVVPRAAQRGTRTLAVNVGGGIIPTVLAIYLIVHESLGWNALFGVAVVAVAVHLFARVVPGVGIVVPTLVPAFVAFVVAWAFDVTAIAALAYVAGTLGTLIGGDVLNLRRLGDLDAPMLSIGGGGTFDGIFVTGILAVLLASI